MSKLGPITKGEWFTSSFQVWAERDGKRFGTLIASLRRTDTTDTVAEADEKLIADAGNTANRTGKLPSELEAEREELLRELMNARDKIYRDAIAYNQGVLGATFELAEGHAKISVSSIDELIAKSTGK